MPDYTLNLASPDARLALECAMGGSQFRTFTPPDSIWDNSWLVEEITSLLQDGYTNKEIAEEIGWWPDSVRRFIKTHKITANAGQEGV